MRTRSDLARAAQRSGMRLEHVAPNRWGELSATFGFDNPWSAAHLLTHLADEDAASVDLGGPEIRAWASAILTACQKSSPGSVAECFARAVQANVQRFVRFVHEPGERFQSSRVTMLSGIGDCDCQARLVYALARLGGLPAALGYFDDARRFRTILPGDPVPKPDGSQPVHVVPLLGGPGGKLAWAETTIPAEFGEEPYRAYQRLKAQGRAGGRAELV